MSREQTVRDVAYAIWEAEGKPRGRDAAHWQEAEARVAASLKGGAKGSDSSVAPSKRKSVGAAEKSTANGSAKAAPAKASAAKAAGAKADDKKKR